MIEKRFFSKWILGLAFAMFGLLELGTTSVFAQVKPLIQQGDLSNKSLEELWKAANIPGKALCFIKVNKNDQLAVLVSPSLGFGAIRENGRSGKLNLGYGTDSPATARQKANILTIAYKGDEHRRACTVEMNVALGKIHSAKVSEGCSDYEDGQDHFEGDLIGASAILSNSHSGQ